MVNLVEELLLLAYNNHTGRNSVTHVDFGVAGAALLDLAIAGRLDMEGKTVVVTDATPVGDPVLDDVLTRITGDKRRSVKSWVQRLSGVRKHALRNLTERGVMRHERHMLLGLIPRNRYLPADYSVESEVRAGLTSLIDRGHTDDERVAALAAVIYALRMERKVFPDYSRNETRNLFKTAHENVSSSRATAATVKAVKSAIATMMAAATSGGGSG